MAAIIFEMERLRIPLHGPAKNSNIKLRFLAHFLLRSIWIAFICEQFQKQLVCQQNTNKMKITAIVTHKKV